MERITMVQFRASPGFFIFRVRHDHKSFVLTQSGKDAALLTPLDADATEIMSDGSIVGEMPITKGSQL